MKETHDARSLDPEHAHLMLFSGWADEKSIRDFIEWVKEGPYPQNARIDKLFWDAWENEQKNKMPPHLHAEIVDALIVHNQTWWQPNFNKGLHDVLKMVRKHGDTRTLQMLIDHGADLKARDDQNYDGSILMQMIEGLTTYRGRDQNGEIIQMILNHAPHSPLQLSKALFAAVRNGSTEICKCLIDNGAPISGYLEIIGDHYSTLAASIFYIEQAGTDDIFNMFLDHPDGPSLLDKGWAPGQCSPIRRAVTQDNTDLLEKLIAAGASVNPPPGTEYVKETPLIVASLYFQYEAGKILLEAGADPDFLDPTDGRSALHNVLRNTGQEFFDESEYQKAQQFAQILIEYGADVSIRDIHNQTPLDLAHSNHITSIAEIITTLEAKRELDQSTRVVNKRPRAGRL